MSFRLVPKSVTLNDLERRNKCDSETGADWLNFVPVTLGWQLGLNTQTQTRAT